MESIKIGDIRFFSEKFNKKSNTPIFVGYEDNGKIIISTKNYERAGFFKITGIKKIADNYTLVYLGERITPEDLYSEISLEEAKQVLKNFGFEFFERKYEFKMLSNEEIRQETQLLAWSEQYGIWLNGTTYLNHFNDLSISFPNPFANDEISDIFKVESISDGEVIINVVIQSNKNILNDIIECIEKNFSYIEENNIKIYMADEERFYNMLSYAYKYLNEKKLPEWYEQQTFNMLPESGKRFIKRHSF